MPKQLTPRMGILYTPPPKKVEWDDPQGLSSEMMGLHTDAPSAPMPDAFPPKSHRDAGEE